MGDNVDSYFQKTPSLSPSRRSTMIESLKECRTYTGKSFVKSSTNTIDVSGKFIYSNSVAKTANISFVFEDNDYKISKLNLTSN